MKRHSFGRESTEPSCLCTVGKRSQALVRRLKVAMRGALWLVRRHTRAPSSGTLRQWPTRSAPVDTVSTSLASPAVLSTESPASDAHEPRSAPERPSTSEHHDASGVTVASAIPPPPPRAPPFPAHV